MLPESRKPSSTCATPRKRLPQSPARSPSSRIELANNSVWSVERGFEIIGEALSQLRKIDAPLAESLTDFRKIISFRNVLIHGYSGINDDLTWHIVQENLPVLLKELQDLLK